MFEAEIHRLNGDLLLQGTSDTAFAEAEACYRKALEVAGYQKARSLELRAATSLVRLLQQNQQKKEAFDVLSPVYDWFAEGFDTADLKEAKKLLNELV